jgi:hypothetical protein
MDTCKNRSRRFILWDNLILLWTCKSYDIKLTSDYAVSGDNVYYALGKDSQQHA